MKPMKPDKCKKCGCISMSDIFNGGVDNIPEWHSNCEKGCFTQWVWSKVKTEKGEVEMWIPYGENGFLDL